jgi:hypothetical protein
MIGPTRQCEEIRELLRVESMRLSSILDMDVLARFLSLSQQPSFAYELEWRRLLRLGSAMRAKTVGASDE